MARRIRRFLPVATALAMAPACGGGDDEDDDEEEEDDDMSEDEGMPA